MAFDSKKDMDRIPLMPGIICAVICGYASFFFFTTSGMGILSSYGLAALIGNTALFIPTAAMYARQAVSAKNDQ